MADFKLQRANRRVVFSDSGRYCYEEYHVTNGGVPIDPVTATAFVRDALPDIYPHVDLADTILHRVELLGVVSPSKVRVAATYQTPRFTLGGLTLKDIRTRSEVLNIPILVAQPIGVSTATGEPIYGETSEVLGVQRTRKWVTRTYYVGAYGEANIADIEGDEAEFAGRMGSFPLPPSQNREAIPYVLSSAALSSDSNNRLFVSYTFWTLLPTTAQELVASVPTPIPVQIPELRYLDAYLPPSYSVDDNQYIVGVADRSSIYGDAVDFSTVLKGVS